MIDFTRLAPLHRFGRLLIWTIGLLPVMTLGQGAWSPPNADLSYPRTLMKAGEVPAVRQFIAGNPDMYALYQSLYGSVTGFTPGNMTVTGQRRACAHAAKNAAFIHLLGVKPVGGLLDTLTAAESTGFRDEAIAWLELMNPDVAAYPAFDEYIWRSDEIKDNAVAYDLLKGAGVPDSLLATSRDLLQTYAGNLHREVSFNLFNLGLFSLHVDNHSLRSCGALGVAAVVLSDAESNDDDERPVNWWNTAMFTIDNILWKDNQRQSEPGVLAGYAEGPHYLRFGMKHCLVFFHALGNFLPDTVQTVSWDGNSATVRHPWHDPNYRLLYQWLPRIRMPDGRFPALEDCFIATSYPEAVIWEDPALAWEVDYSRWHPLQPGSLNQLLRHSSDNVIADFLASQTLPASDTFPHFQALEDCGSIVYRNGWDSAATYLHVYAQNGNPRQNANGHNQADPTSFILQAHGELLALDPGYLKWDRRDEVGQARHHNMILVDGQGPATGAIGSANGADAFSSEAFALPLLAHSRVQSAYSGATILRHPIFVRETYFLLFDQAEDNDPHTYQWRLHGYGKVGGDSISGTFDLDSTAVRGWYQKGGVNLLVQAAVAGGPDRVGHENGLHELRYDSAQVHSTMLLESQGKSVGRFLTTLYPFVTDTPLVQALCGPACEAFTVQEGGFQDFAFLGQSLAANQTGLPADLFSDAGATFYSILDNGDFSQWYLNQGTAFLLGTDTLLAASHPMDLAFQKTGLDAYQGYASGIGRLRIGGLDFVPQSCWGPAVQAWSWDAANGMLDIVTGQEGKFFVFEGIVAGAAQAIDAPGVRLWPNPGKGQFQLESDADMSAWNVFDVSGRSIRGGQPQGKKTQLELGDLPAGMYLLEVRLLDGRVETIRLIRN